MLRALTAHPWGGSWNKERAPKRGEENEEAAQEDCRMTWHQ